MISRPSAFDYVADPTLEPAVMAGLAAVDVRLNELVTSSHRVLEQASRHLIAAGGKRFRPMMVFVAGHFGDPADPRLIPAATVVEMIHLATLHHDDVMDEATVRRGGPTVNTRWTNTVAILSGDYLLAGALAATQELDSEALELQSRTCARLVHGQMAETLGPAEGVAPVDHYLYVVREKTSSLIGMAARVGARYSGAGDEAEKALEAYGEALGVAFQISDDILDIAGDPRDSGKLLGTDLREGVLTLPALYAIEDDQELRELTATPLTDDKRHAQALALLQRSPGLARAKADVRSYADEARTGLASLPDVPARRALEALCDYVLTRTG